VTPEHAACVWRYIAGRPFRERNERLPASEGVKPSAPPADWHNAEKNPKRIGLAIIGGGESLFPAEVRLAPEVDLHRARGDQAGSCKARPEKITRLRDGDYRKLLARPEVTAAIIATDDT